MLIFICISSTLYLYRNYFTPPQFLLPKDTSSAENKPNILLLVWDGIDAERTSLYGYSRNTTPFLNKNRSRFTVFDVAFPNSISSLSSVGSLLSGKDPLTTKLIYYPDILKDRHAFEHLPAFLKHFGYRNFQLGVNTQIDSFDQGFKNAFDFANGRTTTRYLIFDLLYKNHLDNTFYIHTIDRIIPRLGHLLGISDMRDYFKDLVTGTKYFIDLDNDKEIKIKEIINQKNTEESPFFIYAHFMGTHGPWFYPSEKVFSKKIDQTEVYQQDFYDDAILDFDTRLERIYSYLEKSDLLDTTIIIVTSDHGMNHSFSQIPFIISAPDRFKFVENVPVQLLDIAPTIVDAIDEAIPEWLEGESLLKNLSVERKLFFVNEVEAHKFQATKSPLLGYGFIQCDKKFVLTIEDGSIQEEALEGVPECVTQERLDKAQARRILETRLTESGFNLNYSD